MNKYLLVLALIVTLFGPHMEGVFLASTDVVLYITWATPPMIPGNKNLFQDHDTRLEKQENQSRLTCEADCEVERYNPEDGVVNDDGIIYFGGIFSGILGPLFSLLRGLGEGLGIGFSGTTGDEP